MVSGPSLACLQQIGDAFRCRVASFAETNHIPVVPLKAAGTLCQTVVPHGDVAIRNPGQALALVPGLPAPLAVLTPLPLRLLPSRPPRLIRPEPLLRARHSPHAQSQLKVQAPLITACRDQGPREWTHLSDHRYGY